MIIGLAGHKGAGKTTIAKFLEGHGFYHVMFADKIKQALNLIFGFGGSGWNDAEWKETPHEAAYGRTPRQLAQTLGTNWGRHMVHSDIWVDATMRPALSYLRMTPSSSLVISDVRFENEARAIRKAGGYILILERIGYVPTDGHSSEAGIEALPGDVLLHGADGDVEGLKQLTLKVLDALRARELEAKAK
jgi:hypothetical protein